MSVPEILRLEAKLREEVRQQQKTATVRRRHSDSGPPGPPIASCKQIIAATMKKMDFIDGAFTGKLVISFKEGGVSYIEKIEQFK